MYFLINPEDNSVNCFLETEFPDFYNPGGEKLNIGDQDVSYLAEDQDLYDLFWDPDTETLVPREDWIRLSKEELAEFIDQQQALNEALTISDGEKYNKLVDFLAKQFPGDVTIQEMLSDNEVTQDELAQIEEMLNAE
jgi:hypothetical protein